jgi:hypothetical protein
MGCKGIAVAGRVDVMDDVKNAIERAPAPIKGVIHLAMVRREGTGVDLRHEGWHAAVGPKVQGAWNLHHCFSEAQLDFSLMTSSTITIIHQPGESNYPSGCSFLEAFARTAEDSACRHRLSWCARSLR